MNTTNIFVELVVIGFHALIGVVIIVTGVVGYQNIGVENILTINLAVPALVLAYILGILVDRISDSMFIAQDYKMRPTRQDENLPSFLTMRFYILHKSKDIYTQLEYIRSRLRIVRASVFNFILTTIALLIFVWLQFGKSLTSQSLITISLIIFIIGAALTYLSYRSWKGLVQSYSISILRAYSVLRDEQSKT